MLEFNATFIIAIISFSIFIAIMNAIFYKPIMGIIDEREKFINDNYNDARKSKEKIQNLLQDKERLINETTVKSKKIVLEKVEDTNIKSKTMIDEAKKQSAEQMKIAKENLLNEENQINAELKSNIKDLAETISSKILGENAGSIDYEFVDKVIK